MSPRSCRGSVRPDRRLVPQTSSRRLPDCQRADPAQVDPAWFLTVHVLQNRPNRRTAAQVEFVLGRLPTNIAGRKHQHYAHDGSVVQPPLTSLSTHGDWAAIGDASKMNQPQRDNSASIDPRKSGLADRSESSRKTRTERSRYHGLANRSGRASRATGHSRAP
jgi:hypothetical protein